MSKSITDKIKKVRKPRIHISYEVEDGGAQVKKELPFVVGVLGDFSGASKDKLQALKKRKFVNIHGENFNDVMSSISPSIKTSVKNTLKNDGSNIPIEMSFNSMDDFTPGNIVKNVPALKRLLDIRTKLNQLVSKIERSEELEEALSKLLKEESDENLKSIASYLNKEDVKEEESSDDDPDEEDSDEEE